MVLWEHTSQSAFKEEHQLVFGRVLVAIACEHAFARDAVTAEGLFQRALEKLSHPFVKVDPR